MWSPLARGQAIYGGVDWRMAAVVSSSEYTNGATSGDPGITLGIDFNIAALEFGFVQYGLKTDVSDFRGQTELNIKDLQFQLGARLKHGVNWFSRIGMIYHDIKTEAENSQNLTLSFSHDEQTMGFYLGGGIELPFSPSFAFQTSINIETANKDITLFTFFMGFRFKLFDL
jgi:hypothetical protein